MEHEAELTDYQLETIVRIAKERAVLLDRLHEALQRQDHAQALALAREYCGMPSQERPN